MNKPLIVADAIYRSYTQGETQVAALTSATFVLQERDRIAIIGRSGSGKSTLMHLMAGLDMPTSGSIVWPQLGNPNTLLPEQIALVFQSPSLLEPLTVSENIALPLLLANSTVDIPAAVYSALATFHLEDLAQKLPEALSGGQMQRVAMARAIVGNPRVILADEPTGQLDQPTGHALLDALLAHLAGTSTALVISTHDASVAQRMNTIWRMDQGVLNTNITAIEAL